MTAPSASSDTVRDADLVSFDVFDTLVLRPFVRPTDLFRLMEEDLERPGFAAARISAERDARRRPRSGEVTLDDIYSCIPSGFADLADAEVSAEVRLAIPDPEMKTLLESVASSGKDVLLVSDMYLSSADIRRILDRCGIRGYKEIYVSSEHDAGKHSGSLFRIVSEDIGVPYGRMAHIGDDVRSDCKVPEAMGIHAFRRERRIDRYLRARPDQRIFWSRHPDLDRSVIVAMDMLLSDGVLGSVPDDPWHLLGLRYGGPLAYGYAEHLSRTVRSGSLCLFASRDGWTTMRILPILRSDVQSRYVHAQRILSYVLTEDTIPYGRLDPPPRRRERFVHDRTVSHMRYVLGFLGEDLGIGIPEDDAELARTYNMNIEGIDSLRRSRAEEYSEYIRALCGDRDIDLVDSTTMRFTSQRLIEGILGRPAEGHYLVALDGAGLSYESYGSRHSPIAGWTRINIPEFLLCSPEPPLTGWSGGPVFDPDPPQWEKDRMEAYPSVSDGEVEYSERMVSVFGDMLPRLSYGSVVEWSMLASADPEARSLLSGMRWASSPDHSDWRPLLPTLSDVPAALKKAASDVVFRMNRGENRCNLPSDLSDGNTVRCFISYELTTSR